MSIVKYYELKNHNYFIKMTRVLFTYVQKKNYIYYFNYSKDDQDLKTCIFSRASTFTR